MKKQLFLITLLSIFFSFGQVPQAEKDALIALYNATNGSDWTNNTNWNTTQPVTDWYGITVSDIGGQDYVTAIVLDYNNLQGTIPPEIGDFSHLSILFLYGNSGIHGTIPTEIGNLTNLGSLAFAWNYNMTGPIPSSITNLTNLQNLYLNYNNFSGTIPDLTTLPLNTLWLDHNNFEFGDFENEFSAYQNISDFRYTPQNSFYENYTIGYTIGDNTTLTSTVSGNNNLYQWYKVNSTTYFSEDINDATLLTGETSASLALNNLQNTDAGFYYCVVTNTVVTGLEIKKEYFNLRQTVPQIEKDALIALYNATDGPNWYSNANWTTSEPVASWSNVTVDNGHVIALALAAENLTGTLPNDILNLTFLETLYVSWNNLSGTIPDLTNLSNLQILTIDENYFQFGDFENEFSTYIGYNNSGWFSYSPMKKVATEDVYDMVYGTNYTFTMSSVSGTGVTYQWYKNDNPISGATSLTYTITNAQATDAANYTCKASSSIVTDLTIDRNTIHLYDTVLTSDRNALIALYNATDGANWTNNTNWNTSTPVYDWYGVTVVGNRVVEIILYNNNLVGTLPTQIGDLTELKRLDLSYNTPMFNNYYGGNLEGNIPSEIGNLTKLEKLLLNATNFNGTIPTELGNCISLSDLEINDSNLSGTIPTELGYLINLEILHLQNNNLTGNIPVSLANLTKMKYFWLNGNQLSGDVSNLFINMPDLFYFSLGLSSGQHQIITGDVDLSNNTNLRGIWLGNLDITSMDIRNGNNSFINYFFVTNNANLTCIFVDDSVYSATNWTNVDATSTFVETEAECTALSTDNIELQENIIVFPNPTNDILNIKLDNNISIDKIDIFDVNGKKINTYNKSQNISLKNYANGIYFVKINTNKGIIIKKIMKK